MMNTRRERLSDLYVLLVAFAAIAYLRLRRAIARWQHY